MVSFAVRDKWDQVCDWSRVTHHKSAAGMYVCGLYISLACSQDQET